MLAFCLAFFWDFWRVFLFDWMVGFVCMYLNCDRELH